MPFDNNGGSTRSLAASAYERVQAAFAAFGHIPSAEQLDAIRDLLDHLELAADRKLSRKAHVSAIPPGTGKSVSIAKFAATLLDDPTRTDVGMLILVNRIHECEDMATALQQHRRKLCVRTSNPDVNTLGGQGEPNKAQLVITTQEALRRAVKQHGVAGSNSLHYHGERRAVVAWDEQIAFNRPVVMSPNKVLDLISTMQRKSLSGDEDARKVWQDSAFALNRWSWECQTLDDGAVIQVPALGIDFDELEEALETDERLTPIAVALRTVDGDEAKILRQGTNPVIVTHYPEIPPAIMPVIVTDASAKVNASYVKMRRKGVIEWLKDAPKSYGNLTIRVVPMAASRSTFREKPAQAKELLDMAARYVASVPAGEDILIVGYRGRFYMRGERHQLLDEAIKDRLNDADKSRVHWLTYGRHTATNAYRHVKHILLLGLNHMSDALHYAAAGAADGMDLVKDTPSAEDVRAMRDGMLMDSTLQAILRGHARMGTNGNCGECEVVVVQTKRHGLTAAQWREMFPGATLIEDRVLLPPVPLRGRLKELAELVARRLGAGDTEISNQSLYEAMGMDRRNFSALVRKPEWQAHMANLGLAPQRLGKGRGMGLRLVAE